jgi:hypothetical protein
LIRPYAQRIETPARKPRCDGGAPRGLAAIFALAGFRIWDALAVLNLVLIESNGINALRQEAAAVGVYEPENAVALRNSKVPARPKITVGHTAPSGSWHLS